MKTIKGPAIFLAQFAGGGPHLQNLNDMAKWAKECGFIGVQLPSWDGRVMDLKKAAESKTYCDELRGTMAKHGIEPTELSAHLQGQLVAVHPAYDLQFDNFAPAEVHGNPKARQAWAVQQMEYVAKANGTKAFFYEQEEPFTRPILDSVKISGDYLTKLTV